MSGRLPLIARLFASVLVLALFSNVSADLAASPASSFKLEPVRSEIIADKQYVALTDIARIFNATTTWHWRDKVAVLSILGNEVTLLVDSPLALSGQNHYNLYQPTIVHNSQIFVSPLLVTKAISVLTGKEIGWDGDVGRFRVPTLPATVVGIETEIETELTGINLILSRPLKYGFNRLPDGAYLLTVEEGRLDGRMETQWTGIGHVRSIDMRQTPTQLLVRIRPDEEVTRHQVDLLSNPYRLSLRFHASPFDSTTHDVIEQSLGGILAGRDKFDVIVIDPGHGGRDPGALGRRYGTEEKEIALKIATILARMLRERLGVKVIMTRTDDSFVPLVRRAEIANENKADLFISIHCNSHRSNRIAGFELYFLGHAKTDHARAVAQMENAAVEYEADGGVNQGLKDLGFILWDLAQNAYLEESSRIAETLDSAMTKGLSLRSRGVNQNIFLVLVGAFMPSVLVESAYLSNRQEERYLRTAEGQREIASSLYEGVRLYKEQFERRLRPVEK